MTSSCWLAMFAAAIAFCLLTSIPTSYAATVAPLTEQEHQVLFIEFTKRFDKKYDISSFFERFNIFKDNLNWIREFNANPENTHVVEANFFTDLKPEEWKEFMGLTPPHDWVEPNYTEMENLSWDSIPALKEAYDKYPVSKLQDPFPQVVNWVEEGDVMAVRNQGSCGSCYAFSSVSTIESLYLINKANDTSVSDSTLGHFSTQEPVDCARGSPYYCQGCGGGWPSSVMAWTHDNGGICLDEKYPYQGRLGYCKSDQCDNVFTIDSYVGVSGYSETTMARAAAVNPLAIAITAQAREFMYYKTGIINYCSIYSSTQPDHAVTIVGYNLTHDVPYWTIRNSWSDSWGEDGYVRFRFGGNVCKIRSNVNYPTLKQSATPLLDRHVALSDSAPEKVSTPV